MFTVVMRTKIAVSIGILVVILGACAYLVYSYIQSPRYSLYQASKAIDRNDFEGFKYYVDYKRVLGTALKTEPLKIPAAVPEAPEGGKLKTNADPNSDPVGNQLKEKVQDGSLAREFRPTGIYDSLTRMEVNQQGSKAIVTMPGAGSNKLVLEMKRESGRWVVVGIDLKKSKF